MCLSLFKTKPLVRVVLTKEKPKKNRSQGSAKAASAPYVYLENRLKNIECKLEYIKQQSNKLFDGKYTRSFIHYRCRSSSRLEGNEGFRYLDGMADGKSA